MEYEIIHTPLGIIRITPDTRMTYKLTRLKRCAKVTDWKLQVGTGNYKLELWQLQIGTWNWQLQIGTVK